MYHADVMEKIVVLDNIRSAHNVGSIFRTCDGAGVSMLYLCGYTPAPIDRFGRVQPEIEKTSLGASKTVSWKAFETVDAALEVLRKNKVAIVAVEQHQNSISYTHWKQKKTTAYVFGNEIEGVSEAVLDTADAVLEIPMQGAKESLNVSVSVGIILFCGAQ